MQKRYTTSKKGRLDNVPDQLCKSLFTSGLPTRLWRKESEIFEGPKSLVDEQMNKVIFKQVPENIGFLIQEKLHYIGFPRKDTLYHFGLYRTGEEYPFAYCAYSLLEREYIHKVLPIKVPKDRVLVLTRSFSVNSSPENSMSLLFGKSLWYIREALQDQYDYVVTTVNPNLMFTGNVFRGSGFLPFFTTGNNPKFLAGNYITGRQIYEGNINRRIIKKAKIPLVPNVWFVTGGHKRAQKKLLKKMNG